MCFEAVGSPAIEISPSACGLDHLSIRSILFSDELLKKEAFVHFGAILNQESDYDRRSVSRCQREITAEEICYKKENGTSSMMIRT